MIEIAIIIGIGITIWICYELYVAPTLDEIPFDISEDDIDSDLYKQYDDEVE